MSGILVGMSEDVQIIVVGPYSEISLFGAVPLIDYFPYLIAPFAQIKAEGAFVCFVSRIAVYSHLHCEGSSRTDPPLIQARIELALDLCLPRALGITGKPTGSLNHWLTPSVNSLMKSQIQLDLP